MTRKITQLFWVISLVSMLILAFLVLFMGTALAQQGSGSGGNSGGGGGDQDRVQLRDPISDEEIMQQDQLRDQDQIHQTDGSGTGNQGVGDQDRVRLQDQSVIDGAQQRDQSRDQDQLHLQTATGSYSGSQEQNQVRNQIRASSSEGLGLYIQEQTRLQNQQQTGDVEEKVQLRNKSQVAVRSIQVAEEMLGQNGPRMSKVALEVNNVTEAMVQREESLQERSWFRTFLFGQDKQTAQTIQQEAEQNRNRIQEMNQLLVDCGECDGEVKTMLQEQLQTMSQEQDRLNLVAEEAISKRGILGWLFGN